MASFSGEFIDVTYESAEFYGRFSGGESGFAGSRHVQVAIYSNGSFVDSGDDTDSSGGSSDSFSVYFSGLKAETDYEWVAQFGYTPPGGSLEWLDDYTIYGSFTTESKPKADIEPWDWDYSSAGTKAYNACANKGLISDFKYTVWNDMVDKVSEILDYIGEWWDTTYAGLEDTKMTSSDKVMTAVRFNSLRNNIRLNYSVSATRYPLAVKGNAIMGSYFITIGEVINEWIDEL